jgi:hypothetical protein
MAKDSIRPDDRNFTTVHKRIRDDRRVWTHFKGCIGAIDGGHIGAIPPPRDYVRYIGRSDTPTQNVMVVIDFYMCFTYASIEHPGSMYNTSVLFHAIEHDIGAFPHHPHDMYFVVVFLSYNVLFVLIFVLKILHGHAGYSNRLRYLISYKGQR